MNQNATLEAANIIKPSLPKSINASKQLALKSSKIKL